VLHAVRALFNAHHQANPSLALPNNITMEVLARSLGQAKEMRCI